MDTAANNFANLQFSESVLNLHYWPSVTVLGGADRAGPEAISCLEYAAATAPISFSSCAQLPAADAGAGAMSIGIENMLVGSYCSLRHSRARTLDP
jgi:hypothetical protein